MRTAKTINEIFDEITEQPDWKECLVVCSDPDLSRAINKRVAENDPKVGQLAFTAEEMADRRARQEGLGLMVDEGMAVRELHRLHGRGERGFSLEYISGEVEFYRQVISHLERGPVDGKDDETLMEDLCAAAGKYLYSERSKGLLREYLSLPVLERYMWLFRWDGKLAEKHVIVIGRELFSPLQGIITSNPGQASFITADKEGEYRIGKAYIAQNDRIMAENAAHLIENKILRKPENCAIVLDTSGPMMTAVESALSKWGIPYEMTVSASRDHYVLLFMRLLNIALGFGYTRVSEARGTFSLIGIHIPQEFGNFLLKNLAASPQYAEYGTLGVGDRKLSVEWKQPLEKLLDVLSLEENTTFGMFVKGVGEAVGADGKGNTGRDRLIRTANEILRTFYPGEAGRKVTSDNVRMLQSFIRFDTSYNAALHEDEGCGVELVDCSSTYIDRPIVFYLGLDSSWAEDISEKTYIQDKSEEEEREKRRFSILIQQGYSKDGDADRFYFARESRNGRPTIPCPYLDLADSRKGIRGIAEDDEDLKEVEEPISVKISLSKPAAPYTDDRLMAGFSRTSYDDYCTCHMKGLYYGLFQEADSELPEIGKAVHSFAEAYANLPVSERERVKGSLEKYADLVCERIVPIVGQESLEKTRRKVQTCLANIAAFHDSRENAAMPPEADDERDYLGIRYVCHGTTEIDMVSDESPVHGIADLLCGPEIWDYKTGKPKDVSKSASMLRGSTDIDYQALIYLALLRERYKLGPEEKYSFNWLYVGKKAESDQAEPDAGRITAVVEPQESLLGRDYASIADMVYTSSKGNNTAELGKALDEMVCLFRNLSEKPAGSWDFEKDFLPMMLEKETLERITERTGFSGQNLIVKAKEDFEKMRKYLDDIRKLDDKTIRIYDGKLDIMMERLKKDHSKMLQEMEHMDGDFINLKKCQDCKYNDICTRRL